MKRYILAATFASLLVFTQTTKAQIEVGSPIPKIPKIANYSQIKIKAPHKQKTVRRLKVTTSRSKPVQTASNRLVSHVSGCGDNSYAHFIYMHESSCNTNATNPIGCYGIGQACPASKIAHCGSNYSCQNAWFSNYAISTYGSWANAYRFWLGHNWW